MAGDQYDPTTVQITFEVSSLLYSDAFAAARHDMIEQQIRRRGVDDPRVLEAMARVPRHRFVPTRRQKLAYDDVALPIGSRQTISQPYMVAAMTEALQPHSNSRVLEIGTGSGYQTAILAQIAAHVYTIEVIAKLSERARELLASLGYENISFRIGDGALGWPEEAPFDAILVTAAAHQVPTGLLDQLADDASLVMPVGGRFMQDLRRFERTENEIESTFITRCRFVPLVGRERTPERPN